MYYLRLEDKDKVTSESGSGFGWFWRLPFPDEDDVLPGQYQEYNRGLRLCKEVGLAENKYWEDFTDGETVKDPGILQLTHPSGLLVNMPCYHGNKLPDAPPGGKCFWNGKSWSLELRSLRTDKGQVFPIVECRHCGQAWRYEWDKILPYVQGEMRHRLEKYAVRTIQA
jgi:hypothetical protein